MLLYVRYKLLGKNGVVSITIFRHKFCLLCTHCTVGQSKVSVYDLGSIITSVLPSSVNMLPQVLYVILYNIIYIYTMISYISPYSTICIRYEVTT